MLVWITDDDDDDDDEEEEDEEDDSLGGNGVLVVFNPFALSMLENAVIEVCVVLSTVMTACGSDDGGLV